VPLKSLRELESPLLYCGWDFLAFWLSQFVPKEVRMGQKSVGGICPRVGG